MPPMPPGPQVLYVERDMTNTEIRSSRRVLTQLITTHDKVVTNHVATQANLGVGPQPQANASTLAPTNRDFMRINPLTFHATKVDEDPQGFIDDVFKVVDVMGVTPREKANLATYQLEDVAEVWFEQ